MEILADFLQLDFPLSKLANDTQHWSKSNIKIGTSVCLISNNIKSSICLISIDFKSLKFSVCLSAADQNTDFITFLRLPGIQSSSDLNRVSQFQQKRIKIAPNNKNHLTTPCPSLSSRVGFTFCENASTEEFTELLFSGWWFQKILAVDQKTGDDRLIHRGARGHLGSQGWWLRFLPRHNRHNCHIIQLCSPLALQPWCLSCLSENEGSLLFSPRWTLDWPKGPQDTQQPLRTQYCSCSNRLPGRFG